MFHSIENNLKQNNFKSLKQIRIMKNLAIILTALVIFSSCKNPKSETKTLATEVAEPKVEIDSVETKALTETIPANEETKEASVSTGTSTANTNTTAETKVTKKKWSNKKKGVIIGATSGAVAGAVVSKKRGKGALVGGATGAAVGLGVGAILDKKEK